MHRCGTLWLFWGGGGYNITAPNISGIVLQYVRRLVGWRRGSHLQVHILVKGRPFSAPLQQCSGILWMEFCDW